MNLLLFTIELERGPGGPEHAGDDKKGRGWLLAVLVVGAFAALAATSLVGWVLGGGDSSSLEAVEDWLPISTASASTAPRAVSHIDIVSDPPGATVLIDGRKQGQTPISIGVADGSHTVRLTQAAAVDYERQIVVNGDTRLDVSMMRRRPIATPLKAPYPGATINDAEFLADGSVALSVTEPAQGSGSSGKLTAAWVFDPGVGSIRPFHAESKSRSAILAVSPDGTRLAFAGLNPSSAQGITSQRIWSEVMVASAEGSPAVTVFRLATAPAPGSAAEVEEVRDIAWTPDGRQLLVVVRLNRVAGSVPGAPRSRVLLVDADSTDQDHSSALELLNLPAEIVPHSYNWAPDGHWVAFLTLAPTGSGGTNYMALCAVDTSGAGAASGFRYVADLGRQSSATGLLPIAPASWSPNGDGRLSYVAPTPKFTVSNPLGLPTTSGGDPALFLATPTAAGLTAEEGQRLGSATGLIAPVWPEVDATGQPDLLALARTGQTAKSLAIRSIDPVTGAVANLDAVFPSGVGGAGTVSARWDLQHGRLLVLAPHDNSNSGLLDFWLVQLAGRTGAGR